MAEKDALLSAMSNSGVSDAIDRMDRRADASGWLGGGSSACILPLVLAIFFVSGFSALVYQIVWQRVLGFFTGAESVSVAIITSSCMLGIGLGSLFSGFICDSIGKRRKLVFVFAAAELAIGLFGAFSKTLFYDFLYSRAAWLGDAPISAFAVLFAVLLVPTFFMGMTLPIVAKAFMVAIEKAPVDIAWFYAVNTLGSACGAALSALILVRLLGYETTLCVSACLNFVCALGALFVGAFLSNSEVVTSEPAPEAHVVVENRSHNQLSVPQSPDRPQENGKVDPRKPVLGYGGWLLVYAFSGFVALGLEMVWFRLLSVMLKATSITYGWLLFLYLSGLGLGTILGTIFCKKRDHAASSFFLCQFLACAYAVLAFSWFVHHLSFEAPFKEIFEFFGRYDPIDFEKMPPEPWWLFRMFFVLPVALVFPSTALMGMSFVCLQQSVQTDLRLAGRRLGWLQAANIAGATAGSLVVGFLVLHYFKTTGALKFFLASACVFCFLWLVLRCKESLTTASKPNRRGTLLTIFSLCVAASFGIVFFPTVPHTGEIWSKLHGYSNSEQFAAKENGSGLAATGPVSFRAGHTFIYMNGLGHSELPYGDYHSQIGLLPVFLHPNPQDVAVIGLGSGNTLHAAGASALTRRVTCYEIVEPALDCLKALNHKKPYKPLQSWLCDQRISVVLEDGRKGLQRAGRKYDVIEQDPLRPYDSGAGMLYSQEHFEKLKSFLKPGGIAVIWCPTARTMRTAVNTFPHSIAFGSLLVGSLTPVCYNREEVLRAYDRNRLSGYCEQTGKDYRVLLEDLLNQYSGALDRANYSAAELNSDLFPRDEFLVPQ